ncbi:DUF3124 domain-containing protein [bacterium]|nr:DUF3124 domain-containing protein [bacterium]
MPRVFTALAVLLLLAGCQTATPNTAPLIPTLPPVALTDLSIVTGQTVFVPAYAEIFYGSDDDTLPLTTTLAIHNADPRHTIVVSSIRYYDTDGTLVREYVETPIELKPMATTAIVVEPPTTSGGWGTNFLVEWGAETPVYAPVIEAVMVSRQGTEGVSFISEGRVHDGNHALRSARL